MNEELESMLIHGDVEGLCEKYNLYDFQAKMIISIYTNIYKVEHLRNNFLERVNSGYYNEEYQVNSMCRNYLKNAILRSKDNGFDLLTLKCGLNDADARKIIDEIVSSDKAINDMLSSELDVSHINVRVENIVGELVPAFLESYKELRVK